MEDKMLYIGMDISKNFHIAHFRSVGTKIEKGKNIFRIENTVEGLRFLEKKLSAYNRCEILIGMESTGHYWKMMTSKLLKKGYKVQLINTAHVKKYKEIEDNTPNKNDYKDARIISKLLSDGKGLHANISDGEKYSRIKVLYRMRLRIVENLKRTKTAIRIYIERYFPEYEKVFKSGIFIKSSIKLLELGMNGFEKESADRIEEIVKIASRGHYKKGIGKEIKEKYKNSMGLRDGIELVDIDFLYLLDNFNRINSKLKEIDDKLKSELEDLEEWKYISSIPGVGIVLGSGIISELGNLLKYKRSRALVKMSGLNLTRNSSGKMIGAAKISRRGRDELRTIAFRIALNVIRLDKNAKKYYKMKLAQGKSKIGTLIKIGDKILRTINSLVKNKEYYDSKKLYDCKC